MGLDKGRQGFRAGAETPTLGAMARRKLTYQAKAMIRRALERSWSERTSLCFNPDIAPRSYGQCAPTAIAVSEELGGEILKTEVRKRDGGSVRHFYNRVNGQRLDFTADQFDIPGYWDALEYSDIHSSVAEALTEMLPGQIEAMMLAFREALRAEDRG